MDNPDHILIFKTDIRTKADTARLEPALSSHPDISQWNVDVEDIDCVLRVVSPTLSCDDIVVLINAEGYFCCELEG